MYSKTNPSNLKWVLCPLASFLFIFLLSFFLNQSQFQLTLFRSTSLLSSTILSNLKLPSSYNVEDAKAPSPNCTTNLEEQQHNLDEAVAPSPYRATVIEDQESHKLTKKPKFEGRKCDIFDGRWVYDPKAYPLYQWHRCPILDAQVNCQKNGRPDSDYEHWRWEASGCEIPRYANFSFFVKSCDRRHQAISWDDYEAWGFNGTLMLERLRGKRVVIIGDSLNRNQWESLSCLLYNSARPSRVDVKYGTDRVFLAMDYNFSLEFFWSPFLVRLDESKDRSKVLKLDKLPSSARKWQGADVMVFNTGHWWTHTGRMRSWKYFERKGKLVEEMESGQAFEVALSTWARWINRKVDRTKTTVIFRSFSPEHKQPNLQWCYNQTHPMPTNETYIQWFPKSISSTIEKTIQRMKTPVKFLNITRLSEYRRDAHTSVYTVRQQKVLTEEERKQPETYADCSHWCLPGLPDTWNVLLYASLLGEPYIN